MGDFRKKQSPPLYQDTAGEFEDAGDPPFNKGFKVMC